MESENQTQAVALEAADRRFELRRFAWGTPDRLELAGTFGGLPETPTGAPVLVVKAGERVHRLPAVPDSFSGPPANGQVWQAQFAWQDPPVAFQGAELQFGTELIVELPEPGFKRRVARPRLLKVQTAPEPLATVDGSAASVGSQVELLAAQEEVREVQAALEQTRAELARAREDLQAERNRRAADGERFREGLAGVRESAEQALAAEQATVTQLRSQAEATEAARTEAEATADALRKQVEKLESDSQETGQLRSELATAHSAVDEARGDAERLLGRLTSIRAK